MVGCIISSPKMAVSLSPGSLNMLPYMVKKDFAGMTRGLEIVLAYLDELNIITRYLINGRQVEPTI